MSTTVMRVPQVRLPRFLFHTRTLSISPWASGRNSMCPCAIEFRTRRIKSPSSWDRQVTTGTPTAVLIDQRSKGYGEIKDAYRPGHADYVCDAKYGVRDYRAGRRSSAGDGPRPGSPPARADGPTNGLPASRRARSRPRSRQYEGQIKTSLSA
jgi:hypothetical protein